MTYIRWLLGLQSARPVKKVFFPWRESSVRAEETIYHSRRLFYMMRDRDNEVAMLDLETGKTSILTNRAPIRSIRLSGRYLFAIEYSGVTTAWDIHTLRKSSEQRFLHTPIHITVAKDIAVLIPWGMKRTYPLCVWDLRSNQVNEIGSFSDNSLCLFHVDAYENVVVTFEIKWEEYQPEVKQTTWSLTGELLRWKQLRL
ncbi:hypothetical protein VTN31DRAFT_4463 [Thermomyces dupontii]|uniref:uncharacterized protein n=1 Tax=Talaromyces thermophilus TaxID=28565 RepID=UPI003742972B